MFEYCEPNLTVEENDIGITVALTKPVDIEKPLIEIDFEGSKPIAATQRVIRYGDLSPSKLPKQVYREIDGLLKTDGLYTEEKYILRGYSPLDDYGYSRFGGNGNSSVLLRAVPYLRIGYGGLLAFCADERKLLEDELQRLYAGPSFWHYKDGTFGGQTDV